MTEKGQQLASTEKIQCRYNFFKKVWAFMNFPLQTFTNIFNMIPFLMELPSGAELLDGSGGGVGHTEILKKVRL
jgi:hypothetical protein